MQLAIISEQEADNGNGKLPLIISMNNGDLSRTVQTSFSIEDKPTAFMVIGQSVMVDSEKLANALLFLSERRRSNYLAKLLSAL